MSNLQFSADWSKSRSQTSKRKIVQYQVRDKLKMMLKPNWRSLTSWETQSLRHLFQEVGLLPLDLKWACSAPEQESSKYKTETNPSRKKAACTIKQPTNRQSQSAANKKICSAISVCSKLIKSSKTFDESRLVLNILIFASHKLYIKIQQLVKGYQKELESAAFLTYSDSTDKVSLLASRPSTSCLSNFSALSWET